MPQPPDRPRASGDFAQVPGPVAAAIAAESTPGFSAANPHGVRGGLPRTFGAGALVQGLAALAGFAVLPIMVRDLGSAAFGVLLVIVSLGPWLSLIDGALYPATRILSGELRGVHEGAVPRSLLASAVRLAWRIMAINALLLAAALALLPSYSLLGADGVLPWRAVLLAVVVFAAPVIASGPGGVYLGALEGVGRTVIAAIIAGLGPICAFPVTYFVASSGGGLPWLAFIQGLSIGIPKFVAWGYWHWRPSHAERGAAAQAHVRVPLVAQLTLTSGMVLAQTGLAPVIVSSRLGADPAASFGLAWRLIAGATVPLVVLTPLLAGTLAAARGAGWNRRTDAALRKLALRATAAGLVAGLLLLALGPVATRFLGGGDVTVGFGLFVAGAAFIVATYANTALTLAFSGPQAIRMSVLLGIVLTVVSVGGSLWLTGPLGTAGPVWAATLAAGLSLAFWLSVWWRKPQLLAELHTPITV